jgi:hypothetical protein
MTKKNINHPIDSLTKAVLTIVAVLTVLAGAARADDIALDMEGTTATVPKGNTVTRRLFGVPAGIPGVLRLKLKWHAVNLIPNTFNPLKVEVKHGTTPIDAKSACYSVHATKTPRCEFAISVTQLEANRTGNWTIVVTNNSNDEVMGLNIEKGGDINPLVPSFRSVYSPDCPNTVNLDLEGAGTTTITKGGTVTRRLFGIGKAAGLLRLRAKWHAVNLLPVFNALRIELLRPDGTAVSGVSGSYFSIHSSNSPKFDISYNITAAEAAQTGEWSLRVTNNSSFEVIGFNITKESGDLNPAVPTFNSTYKATCQ